MAKAHPYAFIGMNNVGDPATLKKGYSPCLVNVDADDRGTLYQRPLNPFTGTAAVGDRCFFNGRDYWIDGNMVRFGASIESQGIRDYAGVLAEFDVPVHMLVDMVDGLYIGTEDEVVFIGGGSGDPMLGQGMAFRQVLAHGVPRGAHCCKVDNTDCGVDASGYSVFFMAHNGICIGLNSGNCRNLTDGTVAIPKSLYATATVRTIRDMTHYVVRLSGEMEAADQFTPITPTL